MALNIEHLELLLLIAAIVAMLARKIGLPYTVGLVVTGGVLACSHVFPKVTLTRQLIFVAFLPPLIFEAALNIPWRKLRPNLGIVIVLATLGVLIAVGITTIGMHCIAGWSWVTALLFGLLISATDPVSVIATFKDAGVKGRLRLLVEAESLLNDGTAAVLFTLALAAVTGGAVGGVQIAQSLIITIAGAILCGGVIGAAVLALAGRTQDHLVEITLTMVAAYASFLIANHFHFSGVIATLTAGMILGNVGPLGAFSSRGREAVIEIWEYAAFVVNSLIFLLLGIRIAQQEFIAVLIPIISGILIVLVSRAIPVYLCCALFARSKQRVDIRHQHVLVWGGLRGALALALALGLPAQITQRNAITTVAFAVAAFSIIVQGVTITPLMARLGLLRAAEQVPSAVSPSQT